MADKRLIKQVADEFGWTQADIQRAMNAAQDSVTTRDEVVCVCSDMLVQTLSGVTMS